MTKLLFQETYYHWTRHIFYTFSSYQHVNKIMSSNARAKTSTFFDPVEAILPSTTLNAIIFQRVNQN